MEEMKAWQHGYPMDYLVNIQDRYAEYNKYALGPFLEVKKNKVAQSLHEKKLKVTDYNAIEIIPPALGPSFGGAPSGQ